MSKLFSPLTLRSITLKNRIGVSPMCQYSAIDGVPNNWHLVHLGAKAIGGAGLIIAEASAVSPEGRITPACTGIWNDAQVEAWKPITEFISAHGAVPAIQLAHAGRKGSAARPWDGGQQLADDDGGWEVIGPFCEPFDDPTDSKRLWKTPTEMSLDDIGRIQQAFVASAKRALAAGFKLIEIHGAHGYLLHSFFSPLVNKRTDKYGGSMKNRARMMLETVRAVRAVWPDELPLAVRLSTTDWDENGLSVDDNIQMAKWLKLLGVDIVDCSSGGASPTSRSSIGNKIGEQAGIAGNIRAGAEIPTMAVGVITDAHQAEALIAGETADICLLARELLRNPNWPFHAAQILGADTKQVLAKQHAHFVG